MPIRFFISHSERDAELVRPLQGWFRTGLGLGEDEIRCTVVDNMEAGSLPAQQLRDDLHSAEVIIGLITANSLHSHWAQFEMGAGWLQSRLHAIRGPGVFVSDLPKPLSDFTTVGYCDTGAMLKLLHQLAGVLGTSVNPDAEQEFVKIAEEAKQQLVADIVGWFSLPPVLAAWRIDSNCYTQELLDLCEELELELQDLRQCTTPEGVLTRDPDELPMCAKGLWDVSKSAVNYMLSGQVGNFSDFETIPRGVLSTELIADMKSALDSKVNRSHKIRKWFENARTWIADNPPAERAAHGAAQVH